jgi:hypothetical protein
VAAYVPVGGRSRGHGLAVRFVAEEGKGCGGGGAGRAGGGVPGARATGGGGQRAYLRGLGEAGDTGWQRRLALCGGGGSCRVAAAATAAQKVSGMGHPGHRLRAAAALPKCDGERSGGVESARGPGVRVPESRAGSGWLNVKECRDGRCG